MADNFVNAGYWFTHTSTQLSPSDIDAKLFTHLFCGYAGLNSTTYEVVISDSAKPLIDMFSTTVKASNSDVKTLLSIGGDDAKVDRFAAMAGVSEHRASFIKTSISAAREGKFDGLDLQWLYPSSKEDMANLEALLIDWHDAVVKEAKKFNQTRLILVATVFYSPFRTYIKYPIEVIQRTLDWVNVISYDIYTPTSSKEQTGPSSAFYNPKRNSLSANFGIRTWIQLGLHAKKIVFGVPFHGWAWKLENSEEHDVFSPAKGPAQERNTSMEGLTEYRNIEKFIKNNDAYNVPIELHYVFAYTYCETTWIAYEDEDTIAYKISKAKSSLGLLGYFVWNIAGDNEDQSLANAALREWGKV